MQKEICVLSLYCSGSAHVRVVGCRSYTVLEQEACNIHMPPVRRPMQGCELKSCLSRAVAQSSL
jgi:hypothetical protein